MEMLKNERDENEMVNPNWIKLPGLVDVHVHLRVPGGEHKEDFRSGTAAALAGGITQVMAMPNTNPPLTDLDTWRHYQEQAEWEGLCPVYLYCGATMASLEQLTMLGRIAKALKIYLDPTYGQLKVDNEEDLLRIAQAWPRDKVLALHAEGDNIRMGIRVSEKLERPVHFCHVSRKDEIEWIATAKRDGLPVTCEVTPHHLFLTQADAQRLGPLGDMRPRLAEQRDVEGLWDRIGSTIDIVATDHAPHTLSEKSAAQNPPPGVPGLESALPLMLTAVAEGRLSMARLKALMYDNPRRIFNLPEQADTWVEVDPEESYTFPDHPLYTKCGWSPYNGMRLQGRIKRVVLDGKEVVKNGIIQ